VCGCGRYSRTTISHVESFLLKDRSYLLHRGRRGSVSVAKGNGDRTIISRYNICLDIDIVLSLPVEQQAPYVEKVMMLQ
jgi:hypothetical protein